MSPEPSPAFTSAHTCLLIIDMINEFSFEDADKMFPAILTTAERIAELKRRVKTAGFPVIYVNDNFGQWRSDFQKLVARCLEEPCRGKEITKQLHPNEDDYFVLKPKHSAFYATPLELLLGVLNTRRLILTGMPATVAFCIPPPTPICGTLSSAFLPIASSPIARAQMPKLWTIWRPCSRRTSPRRQSWTSCHAFAKRILLVEVPDQSNIEGDDIAIVVDRQPLVYAMDARDILSSDADGEEAKNLVAERLIMAGIRRTQH